MSTEDTRQRAVHRHAQDPPSLADLVAALDRSASASHKHSADSLKLAHETRQLLVALRGLSALAQTWEDEAAARAQNLAGDARGAALKQCARQLRKALAEGVPG